MLCWAENGWNIYSSEWIKAQSRQYVISTNWWHCAIWGTDLRQPKENAMRENPQLHHTTTKIFHVRDHLKLLCSMSQHYDWCIPKGTESTIKGCPIKEIVNKSWSYIFIVFFSHILPPWMASWKMPVTSENVSSFQLGN